MKGAKKQVQNKISASCRLGFARMSQFNKEPLKQGARARIHFITSQYNDLMLGKTQSEAPVVNLASLVQLLASLAKDCMYPNRNGEPQPSSALVYPLF